jgi:alkylhydroperoxidase family enzyme
MSILKITNKDEATGAVAAVYQLMEDRIKFIPNVVKMHSVSSDFFEKFMAVTGFYTDHPTLDPVLVSYIRLLISHHENAEYCIRLQSAVLNNYKVTADDIKIACNDYNLINLDPKRKMLVCFVLDMMFDRLTDAENNVNKLKEVGWTEKDIYEASMLGAVQKGTTKVISAFKVENDF